MQNEFPLSLSLGWDIHRLLMTLVLLDLWLLDGGTYVSRLWFSGLWPHTGSSTISSCVLQALGFGLNYAFEFPVSSACRQHSIAYISQRPQNLLSIYHLSILLVLFLWSILSNT